MAGVVRSCIDMAGRCPNTNAAPADTRKRKRAEADDDVVAKHCEDGLWRCARYIYSNNWHLQLPKVDKCEWCAGEFTINYKTKKPLRHSVDNRVVCNTCQSSRKTNGGEMKGLACCLAKGQLSRVNKRKGNPSLLPPDAKKYELKPILRNGVPVQGDDALYAKLHDL